MIFKPIPIKDMTNRRIATIENIQNQQVQVQNILIEQMTKANQMRSWKNTEYTAQDQITPRAQAPIPSLPHSRESSHVKAIVESHPKSMFEVPDMQSKQSIFNDGRSGMMAVPNESWYV